MSEPARNASALLAEALKPGASLDQITLALEAILAVTAKGLGGDASAYAQYQALLLELHVGSDPHTEPTRRWMASQVYLVEDRFVPEPAGFSAVPVEEFRKKVDAEIEARSRVRHPMSVHLFQGTHDLSAPAEQAAPLHKVFGQSSYLNQRFAHAQLQIQQIVLAVGIRGTTRRQLPLQQETTHPWWS